MTRFCWWTRHWRGNKTLRSERARHKSRIKHGGGQARLNIEDLELAGTTPDDKVLLVDEALARQQNLEIGKGAAQVQNQTRGRSGPLEYRGPGTGGHDAR